MNVLEFIFGIIALLVGGFVILMTATIIADYKVNKKIKKEYENCKIGGKDNEI